MLSRVWLVCNVQIHLDEKYNVVVYNRHCCKPDAMLPLHAACLRLRQAGFRPTQRTQESTQVARNKRNDATEVRNKRS